MTFEKIAQQYNLSRERIRQILAKTMQKIRESEYIDDFAVYMKNPQKAIERIKTNIKENDEMRKVRTIYENLSEYSKQDINNAIDSLTDAEKDIIRLRYGDDLNNPTIGKLTKEQLSKFYGGIIPKLRRRIENPNSRRRKNNSTQISKIESKTVEDLGAVYIIEDENSQNTIEKNLNDKNKTELNQENTNVANNPNLKKDPTTNDCLKILKILRTSNFDDMLKVLSVKEAIIIALKLGYVDDKYFSTEAIANFLQIDESEVLETTKKVLLVYKENLNTYLDEAIKIVTDGDQKSKKLTI